MKTTFEYNHYFKYDEIKYAKDLSDKLGIENKSYVITKEEYLKEFPKIMYYMDEPLADSSAAALYFVANTASKHVKVALSGEGADEIFGGYPWYYKKELQDTDYFPWARSQELREKLVKPGLLNDGDIKIKNLLIKTGAHEVYIDGELVELTHKEFKILHNFCKYPGRVYSRDRLLDEIWGLDYEGDVRTVDVHIRRLREKIEANPSEPKYVHTKWGVGYYFTDKD